MANLKDSAITLLASGTVDLQHTDGKTTVYTVPIGKAAIVTHVVIRNPTASLDSGGTGDFDIGDGANADTWVQSTDLDTLTATTDSIVIATAAKYAVLDAGDAFGIKPITGATLDAQATMDVFGYEYDA